VPLYRSISRVVIGDGRRTSFWHDSWLPRGPLAVTLHVLFSHATCPEVTVAAALRRGIVNILVPRLTPAGERELAILEDEISACPLSVVADARHLVLCRGPQNKLRAGELYRLCRFGGVSSPHAAFIWSCRAPSRVRFFAWLLVQSRIHTRDVLLRKGIVTVDEAGCPLCPEKLETASHMALHCPAVAPFWASVGVSFPRDAHVQDLHLLPVPAAIAPDTASTFVLLCCWHIWK
jgi:hypothetical protein